MQKGFLLNGSQADRSKQLDCIKYMRQVRLLSKDKKGLDSPSQINRRVACQSRLKVAIYDDQLSKLIDQYSRLDANHPDRFTVFSDNFMFDNDHQGLICSFSENQKKGPVSWLCAGSSIAMEGECFQIPLEAVMFAIIKEVFIPNLIICDDNHSYSNWYSEILSIRIPENWDMPDDSILQFVTRHGRLDELPKLTQVLHNALQKLLSAKKFVRDCAMELFDDLHEQGRIPDSEQQKWAHVNIDHLELSVRTSNALTNAGIFTVGELISWTETELLSLNNFGRKSLNELKYNLDIVGLLLQ